MKTVKQIPQTVKRILTTSAEQVERSSGFVQRRSKMNGSCFAQTLVWGWMQNPDATLNELAGMAALVGVEISPQAIDERFTPAAARFLGSVLERAMSTVIASEPVAIPLLTRFTGVYILDSTVIRLPSELHSVWPGVRTNQGDLTAALKVQVRLDYRSGCIDHVCLQSGRQQDRAASVQQAPLPVGSIRLADGGYFSLPVLRRYHDAGVYFLTRVAINTRVTAATGEMFSLAEFVTRFAQDGRVDEPICLGKTEQLSCRLIAWRVSAKSAQRRRRKLKIQSRKQQRPINPDAWALAEWALFVTNVPPSLLSLEEIVVLSKVRWQIELLFKLWKSHAHLARSRSQNPWRILCEVYAKLLVVLVQHWFLLTICWSFPDRSLTKAVKSLRKFVVPLALLLYRPRALQHLLTQIRATLAKTCRLNKRRKEPSTADLLMASS